MAIAKMTKVIIASYRDEAGELLEKLQKAGIIEILNADQAMVSKEWPELSVEIKRPKNIEDLVGRLKKSIDFLKASTDEKDPTSILSPLVEIDKSKYTDIVSGKEAMDLLDEAEKVSAEIEDLNTDYENKQGVYETLHPWRQLDTPVEELRSLENATAITGLLPHQHFDEITERLAELGGALEQAGSTGTMHACVVVCLNDAVSDAQKILRSGDFEAISFEHFEGTIAKALDDCEEQLARIGVDLGNAKQKAAELAKDRLSLQILFDHYSNLSNREQTQLNAPATENTVLLEGWVKEHDYEKAEKIVNSLAASSIGRMDVAEDEETPAEIENSTAFRPFETITRLYGMPSNTDVDPTAFLAPFFTLFFGICLTDAGYGIILAGILWLLIRKLQGDKKALIMFMACAIMSIIAGALTGSWFSDAAVTVLPEGSGLSESINGFIGKLTLFNPMEDPMTFFKIALGLGYLQILFGICIAFFNNIKHKDYATAIFNHLTWFILLNSLLTLGLCKNPIVTKACGILAIILAVIIFLFSERNSGMAGRIGGGLFAVFGAVFYFGDILSYVRLMALGMVTAGLGMAVNILVRLLMDIDVPVVGYVLGGILFVGGHLFNLAMGVLSAFVHSLRLQFVEFFPKFLSGGGKDFKPMKETYDHVLVKQE